MRGRPQQRHAEMRGARDHFGFSSCDHPIDQPGTLEVLARDHHRDEQSRGPLARRRSHLDGLFHPELQLRAAGRARHRGDRTPAERT